MCTGNIFCFLERRRVGYLKKNKFQIKREATYAKLIQAGFEIFCEKGYSGTTIDDIVDLAGFTKGAFYVHFETKEQLLLELMKYRKTSRADMLSALFNLTEMDIALEQIIQKLMNKVIGHLTKTPEWILVYVDFFNRAKSNPEASKVYRDYYNDWVGEIKYFIDLLKQKELISMETDSLEKAKMFYAYFDGCLLHANLYGKSFNEPMMTKFFLALLRDPN